MALSRISLAESPDGWASRRSTSSTVRITGAFFSILGAWMDSDGSFLIRPRLNSYPKNAFMDARFLDTVDAAFPSFSSIST